MTRELSAIADEVLGLAKRRRLSIVVSESCTAGLISQILSQAPGAAEHFQGSFVTYTKDQKACALGVSKDLLRAKGAVCCEVAEAMAQGALRHSVADLAIGVTGVAGPDPDEDGNVVGLVCLATVRRGGRPVSRERHYGAIGREAICKSAALDALEELGQMMEAADAAPG